MPYINIHTHYRDKEEDILQILNPDIRDKSEIEKIIDKKNIYLSLGIHPWYIEEGKIISQVKLIESLAENNKVLMIGESGIDHLCSVDINLQKKVFEKMIEISEEFKKPLIIHNVRSNEEIIAFHKNMNPFQPWIIHGFRGNETLMNQLIDNGLYISYGPIYNSYALKATPLNRMFLENDES